MTQLLDCPPFAGAGGAAGGTGQTAAGSCAPAAGISSDTMCYSNGVKESTPSQNRQLIV